MFIPWLFKEKSIDDFVDKEGETRLSTLLADEESASQEDSLYQKEIVQILREALVTLPDRERTILWRFALRPSLGPVLAALALGGCAGPAPSRERAPAEPRAVAPPGTSSSRNRTRSARGATPSSWATAGSAACTRPRVGPVSSVTTCMRSRTRC